MGAPALGLVLCSQTILFDGLYSFVTLALSLVSPVVVKEMRRRVTDLERRRRFAESFVSTLE